MFHERTPEELKKIRRRRYAIELALIAAVVGGVYGYSTVVDQMREQAAVGVHDAILESAKQCCAIEGAYPESLSHLEKQYGLNVNHDDFIIAYEYYGGNIAPSVMVVPR